jgi:predicted short-subunit dehydrogenase-like oxidoreductase (DUF2520 family)
MAGPAISTVVIIGAGNLGTHLARVFRAEGIGVLQIFDRNPSRAEKLAHETGCETGSLPDQILNGADLYLLSVSDSAIEEVAQRIGMPGRLMAHCSGAVPMDVLKGFSEHYGVFYPLQTFSADRSVSFAGIPVCVEANHEESLEMLTALAKKISGNVHRIDSRRRALLHLTAVFANNFTNFMYTAAEEILKEAGLPFDLLGPIIAETAASAREGSAFARQTGPAIRGDHTVMDKHREILSEFPEFLELYNLISQNIIKFRKLHGQL